MKILMIIICCIFLCGWDDVQSTDKVEKKKELQSGRYGVVLRHTETNGVFSNMSISRYEEDVIRLWKAHSINNDSPDSISLTTMAEVRMLKELLDEYFDLALS